MPVAIFPFSNNLLHSRLPRPSIRAKSSSRPSIKLASLASRPHRAGFDSLDTNSRIRALVADLLADGLSQITIAHRLGVSPSWFSRWLNAKDDRAISVDVATRLLGYLRKHGVKLGETIQGIETALTQSAILEEPKESKRARREVEARPSKR